MRQHAIVIAGAVLAALSVAEAWESHPPDVGTATNLEAACRPPPRPVLYLRQIKREMVGVRSREVELDHRIPRCIGGSDDPSNLWLQRCDEWAGERCVAGPAAVKDIAEAEWCHKVCDLRTVSLAEAQQFFRMWKDQ